MKKKSNFLPDNQSYFGQALQLVPAPNILDGSTGANRSSLTPWIAANKDSEAVKAWLGGYSSDTHTYRAYEKEALRLLLWARLERKTALASMLADDFDSYFKFLADPPAHWITNVRAPRNSPHWRPMRAALKPNSIKQVKIILNQMMVYLVDARYLAGNPLSIVRTRQVTKTKKTSRYLQVMVWEYFWSWLEKWPTVSARQQRDKLRCQVLFGVLYLTAARLSEVALATMGDIRQDERRAWWWHVVGKGNKEGKIPVTPQLLDLLKRYRIYFGLLPLPSPGENTPLIFRSSGPRNNDRLSDNMIHRIVKKTLQKAAADAQEDDQHDIAARLKLASTHWLRHTSLTHQGLAGMDVVTIRDNARHSSLSTTSLYLNDEDNLRHAETAEQFKLPSAAGD